MRTASGLEQLLEFDEVVARTGERYTIETHQVVGLSYYMATPTYRVSIWHDATRLMLGWRYVDTREEADKLHEYWIAQVGTYAL